MRANLLAFALGVWLLQLQPALPDPHYLWFFPLAATLVWLPKFPNPSVETLRQAGMVLLCLALGFAWAAWRAELRLAMSLPGQWQGTDITLSGVVAGLPDRDAHGERFDFDVERIATPGARVPQHIRLSWPNPHRDSQQFRIESMQANAGSSRFGSNAPMAPAIRTALIWKPGCWNGIFAPAATCGRKPTRCGWMRSVNQPVYWVQRMRDEIRQRIFATLGQESPEAGLIAALTVGDQNAIPAAGWRVYNRTGTSHLVSISGLHVTLFAVLVMWVVSSDLAAYPGAEPACARRQGGTRCRIDRYILLRVPGRAFRCRPSARFTCWRW